MKTEKYREFFTKEYMMGPNCVRLLDELLENHPDAVSGGRVLDLGCGEGLSTMYLAGETDADLIFAQDLWISAKDNGKRFRAHGLGDRVIPVHADALDCPFAEDSFDAIVSVDAYHYFGCADGVFAEKILPLVKVGGSILISVPGARRTPNEKDMELLKEWAEDEWSLFCTPQWWDEHIRRECGDSIEIHVYESAHCDQVWQDWYDSGHEFALRDKDFLDRGLKDYLNFVMMDIRRIR